jgi:hypothetical protein
MAATAIVCDSASPMILGSLFRGCAMGAILCQGGRVDAVLARNVFAESRFGVDGSSAEECHICAYRNTFVDDDVGVSLQGKGAASLLANNVFAGCGTGFEFSMTATTQLHQRGGDLPCLSGNVFSDNGSDVTHVLSNGTVVPGGVVVGPEEEHPGEQAVARTWRSDNTLAKLRLSLGDDGHYTLDLGTPPLSGAPPLGGLPDRWPSTPLEERVKAFVKSHEGAKEDG